MSRIGTQRVAIWSDDNPLDVTYVNVPVRRGQKIFCHEPYLLEALKMYEGYTTEEIMKGIAPYEVSSFKDVAEGVVDNVSNNKASISLSGKHSAVVDLDNDASFQVGSKIDVVVHKEKGRITVDATQRAAQVEVLRRDLIKQIQTPTSAYVGCVKEIAFNSANTFNGFIVDVGGVKCFMPGSESDVVPLNDYNTLVGESIYVMPIAVSKDSIVVSHKAYLDTIKASVIERLSNLDKGAIVTGKVSSIKQFGVFILIDECVPTLLSVSEMDDVTGEKFKAGGIQVGDDINFYIDSVNGERVVVTQTVSKFEGWAALKAASDGNQDFKVNGAVKNVYPNGVVIALPEYNNITFFLSSKVVDMEKMSVGNDVEFSVSNVDAVKKTVRINI